MDRAGKLARVRLRLRGEPGRRRRCRGLDLGNGLVRSGDGCLQLRLQFGLIVIDIERIADPSLDLLGVLEDLLHEAFERFAGSRHGLDQDRQLIPQLRCQLFGLGAERDGGSLDFSRQDLVGLSNGGVQRHRVLVDIIDTFFRYRRDVVGFRDERFWNGFFR